MDIDEVSADPVEIKMEALNLGPNEEYIKVEDLGIWRMERVKSKEEESAALRATGQMNAEGKINKDFEDCLSCYGNGCGECKGYEFNTGCIVWPSEEKLESAMRDLAEFLPLEVPWRQTRDGTSCAEFDRLEDLPIVKMVTLLSLDRDDHAWSVIGGKVKGVDGDKEQKIYMGELYDQWDDPKDVYASSIMKIDDDGAGCILYSDILDIVRQIQSN